MEWSFCYLHQSLQLDPDFGKLRFALGQRGADGGKLLALGEESDGIRGLLEDDFGWHAPFREWNF